MQDEKNDRKHRLPIEDASAWILRVGVVSSVIVMLVGLGFSFVHGTVPVERMQSARFEYNPIVICRDARAGHGQAIIEIGIYLLLATPIMRVAASTVLFGVEERDWLYTAITLGVLGLTVAGLLLMK
jgi:uncharacterized membrane protein